MYLRYCLPAPNLAAVAFASSASSTAMFNGTMFRAAMHSTAPAKISALGSA